MCEKPYDFNSAVTRIIESLDADIQSKLAEALGLTQPTIHYGLSRCSIPNSWLLSLLRRHSLNPDWVLHGEPHKKYMVPADEKPEIDNVQSGQAG